MKKLLVNNEVYTADKIIKTDTAIIGLNGDTEVFAFRGISDISKFELEDGQEFDIEINEVEEIKQALAELTILIATGGM